MLGPRLKFWKASTIVRRLFGFLYARLESACDKEEASTPARGSAWQSEHMLSEESSSRFRLIVVSSAGIRGVKGDWYVFCKNK